MALGQPVGGASMELEIGTAKPAMSMALTNMVAEALFITALTVEKDKTLRTT